MQFAWNYKSGPNGFNLDAYIVQKIPTWIKIPECILEPQ